MKNRNTLLLFILLAQFTFAQNYTSYFTGNSTDLEVNGLGGVCLMGGATEHDEAMRWFLERANGGDVLVLRASGSNGYNDYLYSELGVTVNSVETIVCHNANSATESYIHDKIKTAEAIWFAGGDQWNYISYWRNTAIDSLINEGINERNIVIGGTSAGMAIQGGAYFSAENGTVTSATALSNPYNANVTVGTAPFLDNNYLAEVITDSHYDNPDRKGRHTVFIARLASDYGWNAKGIACDEYTAVCIDENGNARVYGEYPAYDETAYFIQMNCEIENNLPEVIESGVPLTWNQTSSALKVYAVKGTMTGANSFELSDWTTGSGGEWEHWYVENGVFYEETGTAPNCSIAEIKEAEKTIFSIYPNPNSTSILTISSEVELYQFKILTIAGKELMSVETDKTNTVKIDIASITTGIHFIEIHTEKGVFVEKWIRL